MKLNPDFDKCYSMLKQLLASEPHFVAAPSSVNEEDNRWLGQLHACLKEMNMPADAFKLDVAFGRLGTIRADACVKEILQIAHNALAHAEMNASNTVAGGYIAVGAAFDFHAVLSGILKEATKDVLIVDPYMNGQAVTDVVALCPDGLPRRLLADEGAYKVDLKPAVESWIKQFGATLEARLTPPRALHDRLIIIDFDTAYILTQSIKDFAARSSGAVQKMDADSGKMKIDYYDGLWAASAPLN